VLQEFYIITTYYAAGGHRVAAAIPADRSRPSAYAEKSSFIAIYPLLLWI
jgi:hypothetical protein